MSQQESWEDERGFTLIELLVTIILMGIVMSVVAFSAWGGWIEARRVDSATNQLAADLRQAHSKAINRLAPQTVTLTSGNSEYTMTGAAGTLDLDEDPAKDVVVVNAATSVVFNADGSAVVTGANPITVRSSEAPSKDHTIDIKATTSRVQVVP
jgi:prepilin-type N-terminal cleavage/methylation domain-containing protein